MSPSRSGHEVDVPAVARARRRARPRTRRRARTRRRRSARAIVRAASRGSPSSAMSTSSVGAAEQPVAHGAADEPRLAAGERLAGGLERLVRHAVLPRHARRDAARDLVVDRPEPRGELLGEDPLAAAGADQHRLGAALDRLVAEVDGDVVHRDGAHQRHAAAVDEHVGVVGEPAPDAVAVADRDGAEPRLALGHEAAAVAGALPRPRALDLGDVADQLERGLEPVVGGVAVERVHAVDGDAAAHHVEAGGRLAQRRGRVGGVHGHAGMAGDPRARSARAAPRGSRRRPRRPWRSASSARRAGRPPPRPPARPRPGRACPAGPSRCRA